MRVYTESNFVLEIVLEQEQHQACEELVKLAADKSIELVLPAFALIEPYETLRRREIEWEHLREELDKQARQLKRTASFAADIQRMDEARDLLVRAPQEAWRRFLDTRTRLLDTAHLLAVEGPALREASKLAAQIDLQLPDALMLACVLADAAVRRSPSVFLNRNTKDFANPNVRTRLKQVDCDLIMSFKDGLERVTHELAKPRVGGG
jgi:hypothetical protein